MLHTALAHLSHLRHHFLLIEIQPSFRRYISTLPPTIVVSTGAEAIPKTRCPGSESFVRGVAGSYSSAIRSAAAPGAIVPTGVPNSRPAIIGFTCQRACGERSKSGRRRFLFQPLGPESGAEFLPHIVCHRIRTQTDRDAVGAQCFQIGDADSVVHVRLRVVRHNGAGRGQQVHFRIIHMHGVRSDGPLAQDPGAMQPLHDARDPESQCVVS